MTSPEEIHARKLAREISAREQAESLLEQKSIELYNQAQERERAVTALRESEERYRMIVELSPDAIIIEVEGQIVFANSAARILFSETKSHNLLGESIVSLAAPEYRRKAEEELQLCHSTTRSNTHSIEHEELAVRLDGTQFEVSVQRVPLSFGGKAAIQMVARDISIRKQLERQLAHQANHDTLTGIPNRKYLIEMLGDALAFANRHKFPLWVAFLDLDRFKFINDRYGHRVGDQLLVTVTNRLQTILRKSDTAGRFGGDEFILVLRGGPDEEMSESLLERVMAVVCEPMLIEGHRIQLTCSLGIATYPGESNDSATLIEQADMAMYHAKESGRNMYQFYTAEMNQKHVERSRIEMSMGTLLERDELFLLYQPQVDVQSGRIVGVEALLRWQHPELGLLEPSRFISIAEESRMITKFGAWALHQACQQGVAWQRAGYGPLRIAVNMSVRQMVAFDLISIIESALSESGLEPHCLELELTETQMMAEIDLTLQVLKQLRAMGVQIAIDDFGTGYSSLAYLKRLPLDCLKIDQSFVQGLEDSEDSHVIVRTLIQLGQNLKLRVIAEGVETEYQKNFLLEHGCNEMQGYIFSKPQQITGIEMLLQKQALRQT